MRFLNKNIHLNITFLLLILYLCVNVTGLAQARKRTTPIDHIRKLYMVGKIGEARAKASKYVNNLLKSMQERELSLFDMRTNMITSVIAAASFAELEYKVFESGNKQQDESSRKFLDNIIQIMERASKLAEDKGAYSARLKREKDNIEFIKDHRAHTIEKQINLSTPQRAEELFKRHEKILTSRGLRMEDIIKKRSVTTKGAKQLSSQLVDTARKELYLIKATLSAYYQSLESQDIAGLRAVLSKDSPPKAAENLLKEIEYERDVEKDFDELLLMRLDEKSQVKVVGEKDGNIVVHVKGIKVKIMKNGKEKITRQKDKFRFAKEEEKWLIKLHK